MTAAGEAFQALDAGLAGAAGGTSAAAGAGADATPGVAASYR